MHIEIVINVKSYTVQKEFTVQKNCLILYVNTVNLTVARPESQTKLMS